MFSTETLNTVLENTATEYTIKTYPKFNKEFKKLTKKCPSIEENNKRLKKKVLLPNLKRGDHKLTHNR